MNEKLSIAVPCFNEEKTIPYFYEEMKKVFTVLEEKHQLEIELLFVDDGSRDGTLKILRELARHDKRVKYLSFSKNFGKESGIYAGLSFASGDFVAIMDADLQNPPMLLCDKYDNWIYKVLAIIPAGSVVLLRHAHKGRGDGMLPA